MGTEPPLPGQPLSRSPHSPVWPACTQQDVETQRTAQPGPALRSLLSLQADRQVKPCATSQGPLTLWGS